MHEMALYLNEKTPHVCLIIPTHKQWPTQFDQFFLAIQICRFIRRTFCSIYMHILIFLKQWCTLYRKSSVWVYTSYVNLSNYLYWYIICMTLFDTKSNVFGINSTFRTFFGELHNVRMPRFGAYGPHKEINATFRIMKNSLPAEKKQLILRKLFFIHFFQY